MRLFDIYSYLTFTSKNNFCIQQLVVVTAVLYYPVNLLIMQWSTFAVENEVRMKYASGARKNESRLCV